MILDALETLKTLVGFQSVSADSAYKGGLLSAVEYLTQTLGNIGFQVEVIETTGQPIILAERINRVDAPTVIIYGHYDVQPVDPIALWESDPFVAEIRGDRIYGRGAADNKGPVSAMLAVVSKLYAENPDRPLNIRFLLEGEEEIGSPSFAKVLEDYKDRLKGDFVLACDSGSQTDDQIVITAGLRGITCFEVKAVGPTKDLHSGVYGGAVLNPLMALIDLCHSMHNPDGTVNVPGFYDAVLPVEDWEREELRNLGLKDEELKDFLGVPALFQQPNLTPNEAIRFAPTLEFNGFWGGYQGEGSKTVIPKEASVKISCRLVAEQDPEAIKELVIKAFEDRCPDGVRLEFKRDHDGHAYLVVPPGKPNTDPDLNPVLAKAFLLTEQLSETEFGKKSCYTREGGSIPIIKDIKDILGLDSLLIGLYLPEDGMHAPNESFSLKMLEKGQVLIEKLLSGLEQ